MEIELKLLLAPANVAAFRGHPLLKQWAIGKPRQQPLTSVYFDTPDLYFKRHDAALRVRQTGRQWLQTLKGGGQVAAGLHQRDEWESRVNGPQPDLPALITLVGSGSAWAERLSDPALAERLVPVFTTRVRRTLWQLRLAQGDEIELALDQGDIRHGAARQPLSEIELELKSGDPARLYDLTLALLQTVPLRVGNISKAERGYALYAPQPPVVVTAARLALTSELTVEQAFQAIIGNCLAQVQGNEAGVTQGSDPESVHQMRVGMRRLRSALGLFGKLAPCPDVLHKELDWLASELGAARDWDVFAGGTLQQIAAAQPEALPWASLQQAAFDMAQKNRKKAANAVRSVRYARLMLSFGGWLQGTRWREALAPPEQNALIAPLTPFATQTLARRHRTLKKRGKRLHGGTPQVRHRVRIAAKNLRYAAEFFHVLYPAKRLRRYIATLTALQEGLGGLNDISVADGLLRQLAQTHAELAHSSGFIRGCLSSCSQHEGRQLGPLWQHFAHLKPVGRP